MFCLFFNQLCGDLVNFFNPFDLGGVNLKLESYQFRLANK